MPGIYSKEVVDTLLSKKINSPLNSGLSGEVLITDENGQVKWSMIYGRKGESIYELAVSQGKFEGTEEEFVDFYLQAVLDARNAADNAESAFSYRIFRGATLWKDGLAGLVPLPKIEDREKFLKGDGTWTDIPKEVIQYNLIQNLTLEQKLIAQTNIGAVSTESLNREILSIINLINSIQYLADKKIENILIIRDLNNPFLYKFLADSISIGEIATVTENSLSQVSYSPENNTLVFSYNTFEGLQDVIVNVSDLIRLYTEGEGIKIVNNKISLKVVYLSESEYENLINPLDDYLYYIYEEDTPQLNVSVVDNILYLSGLVNNEILTVNGLVENSILIFNLTNPLYTVQNDILSGNISVTNETMFITGSYNNNTLIL